MKGDFSRFTRQPAKQYGRVLLQQGRVLLDADFNEQGGLAADGLRQLTRDLLGPSAGPAGNLGFAIGESDGSFTIAWGHYYVDGWLVAHVPPAGAKTLLRYENQPAFPFPGDAADLKVDTAYFFYLDAWERPVSWLEDDAIRESALGGPDTALRTQLVWHVRAVERPVAKSKPFDTADAEGWLTTNIRRHPEATSTGGLRLPLMRAFVDPKDNPDDTPCVADPLGGYTGLENQLYRVEIHAAPVPGSGPAEMKPKAITFKWSRDNGSVVAALIDHAGDDLVVAGVRDTAHGFSAGQWVEIIDKEQELHGTPGVLVQLLKVDRDHLTYDRSSASESVPTIDPTANQIVRRWDHGRRRPQAASDNTATIDQGAIVLLEDVDYPLEHGIRIRFPKQAPGATNPRRYATGDYWTFAARAATADIEWPFELQTVAGQTVKTYQDKEPDGVEHAYAPLAVGTLQKAAPASLKSLQRKIIPLTAPA